MARKGTGARPCTRANLPGETALMNFFHEKGLLMGRFRDLDDWGANGEPKKLREWWHFTLVGEPFPDTYFDFSVR